ncbi:MAG: hypothetical protein FWD42_11015, partial [Solirubrobacterales bacterium]|nr:hypothetical protein [Solirubrobacterales bacterium]
ADIILGGWPQVARAQAELLSECLVRLAISHAVLPTTDTAMSAASITTLLDPYIERVLAEAR